MKSFREVLWWDNMIHAMGKLGQVICTSMQLQHNMELAVNHSDPEVRSACAKEISSFLGLLFAGFVTSNDSR